VTTSVLEKSQREQTEEVTDHWRV